MCKFSFIDFYKPTSFKKFRYLVKKYSLNKLNLIDFAKNGEIDLPKRNGCGDSKSNLENVGSYCEEFSREEGFRSVNEMFNYAFNNSNLAFIVNLLSLGFLIYLTQIDVRVYYRLIYSLCYLCFSLGSFSFIKSNYPIMLVANVLNPSNVKFKFYYFIGIYLESLVLILMVLFSFIFVM